MSRLSILFLLLFFVLSVHLRGEENTQSPKNATTPGELQTKQSQIEIYDIENETTLVVREFDHRVEAPEWTPDGKWLYFNSQGRIYRISPEGGEPLQINTGDLASCNNDHVISPDGKTLAISAGAFGQGSVIFTLPVDGGAPELVTEKGPSYLHGWSPDGKTLAFTGKRGSDYNIYTIGVDGQNETRLTDAPALDDGPEYSPDGKHIWFNSARTGLMQLWRMNSDGGDQTQMLKMEAHCWFPHVSPDGKSVFFLAYDKNEVSAEDHPANKNVTLQMISSAGGEPKILVSLYGGQGTCNVNSWSPDGKQIAYVRYFEGKLPD